MKNAWILFSVIGLFCAPFSQADVSWPHWRGPSANGSTEDAKLPVSWTNESIVKWKAPLPEPGNSTPVVWKDFVFVTQAKGDQRLLLCFSKEKGTLLWQAGPTVSQKDPTHDTNPYCAASPVTDGKHVYAWFGSAGVYCFDLKGKEVWKADLGKQHHLFGYAASPVLYQDFLIVNFGPGARSFVTALNKKTGQKVWEYQSPGLPASAEWKEFGAPADVVGNPNTPKITEVSGSWCSPVVCATKKRDELVIAFSTVLVGLDPKTGKEFWRCQGVGMNAQCTPVQSGDIVTVAGGGYESSLLAVKLGGSGDVTETHRIWFKKKARGHLGSGVVHEGLLFMLSENGIAECFDVTTGDLLWEERLKAKAARGSSWSSLIRSGKNIYASNQSGEVFVFEAARQFKLVSANLLPGEPMNASPVAADGKLFLRTSQHLWCLEGK